ncbi:hypothetical protein VUR80DRAFT_3805 [Thermomyces stellatus]
MPDEEAGLHVAPATNHGSLEWESRGRKRSSILDWLKGGLSPLPPSAPPKDAPSGEPAAKPSLEAGPTRDANRRPSKLDALFRPDRTYLGLSRNRFVFFVIIPAVTVVLIILPVALGVGLSRERSRDDVPLPSRDGPFEGVLTFYDPGLGACGRQIGADDMVVAVSRAVWDSAQEGGNPNQNPLCGRKIVVETASGADRRRESGVEVRVVDRCTGCAAADLDVSRAVFRKLAKKDEGRVLAKWDWVD